jgi:hypothetical protein
MKTCSTCGHKENPKQGYFCLLKQIEPPNKTCIMWIQGKISNFNPFDFDLPDVFKDVMGDFFNKGK